MTITIDNEQIKALIREIETVAEICVSEFPDEFPELQKLYGLLKGVRV